MTTNRVLSIDAAVQSRVQLAIQYEDLTPEQRLAIYKNRLKWVPDEEMQDRAKLEEQLKGSSLCKKNNKANGRQIRNIVTYARALAKRSGEKLTIEHLIKVDKKTTKFITSIAENVAMQRLKNEAGYS